MRAVGPIAIRPLSSSSFFDDSILRASDHVARLGSRVKALLGLQTYTTQTLSAHTESALYATLLRKDGEKHRKGKIETLLGDRFSSRLSCDIFTACHYHFVNETIRHSEEEQTVIAGDDNDDGVSMMSGAGESWVRRSSRRRKQRVLFSPGSKAKTRAKTEPEAAKPCLTWDIEPCETRTHGNIVIGFLARRSVLRPSVVAREMSPDFLFLYFMLRRKVRTSSGSSTSSKPQQVGGAPPIYGTRVRLEMYLDESVFKEKCSSRERADLLLCIRAVETEALRQIQSLNLMSLLFKASHISIYTSIACSYFLCETHQMLPNRNGKLRHLLCPYSRLLSCLVVFARVSPMNSRTRAIL